ncbi:hypothetical protein [Lyngbya aestuarii]|uniref:hypothetical protein n=1 Tax=Lyngbya aestuarii TaxID=118322 RepID=UPI00403E2D5D
MNSLRFVLNNDNHWGGGGTPSLNGGFGGKSPQARFCATNDYFLLQSVLFLKNFDFDQRFSNSPTYGKIRKTSVNTWSGYG